MQIKTKQKKICDSKKLKYDSFNLTAMRGFSIIELIITVSIMMIVTSAVLFRQSKFSSDILITNMAYEVALSIREASVLGLSSQASSTIPYNTGYGVHFAPGVDGVSPTSFINFVDISSRSLDAPIYDGDMSDFFNYFYDGGDAIDKNVDLTQGQSILGYCAYYTSWECFPANPEMEMSIVYARPNPDAHIRVGSDGSPDGVSYSEARIVVQSGLGDKCRTVVVSASGQISVAAIDPTDNTGGCLGGMPEGSL